VLFPEERSNDIQQMGWGNYPFIGTSTVKTRSLYLY